MTLASKQRELSVKLAAFRNVQQRLAWLVEQARQRPPMAGELQTDAHRVPGCLSRLWFVAEFLGGHCHFQCESDSLIVKSIAGLLCDFYSGQTPEEILAHDPGFLGEFGIAQHVTPNRRNALARIWQEIRAFAADHAAPGAAEGDLRITPHASPR